MSRRSNILQSALSTSWEKVERILVFTFCTRPFFGFGLVFFFRVTDFAVHYLRELPDFLIS